MNENNNVVNNQVPGQGVTPNVAVSTTPTQPTTQPSVSTGGGTSGAAGTAIVCDKCGTTYSSSQRYCMKCGNLNYSHPSTQSMKQYLNYDVVNQNYINNGNVKLSHTSVDPYAKEKRNCILWNAIIHIIIAALPCFIIFKSDFFSILSIISVLISAGVSFISVTGFCLMFVKAKEPWWFYYIPILNFVTIARIAFGSGWYSLLYFVPIVNFVTIFVTFFKIGKRFGYSGLLTMLFSAIMIPIIGFGSREESLDSLHGAQISLGDDELDSKGRTKTEAEYGKKKGATVFGVLLVVGILVVLLYPYILEYGGNLLEFLVDKYHEFVEFIGEMN